MLSISVIYHIIHASFVSGFLVHLAGRDGHRGRQDAEWITRWGKPAPEPRKFAKYPLENKLYHLIVLLAGLSAIVTGLFMMKRVRTPFFTRNPYLFSDMTWGWMYVLHGLAGVGIRGARHRAHLYGDPPGKILHHQIDDLRLDDAAKNTWNTTTRAAGRSRASSAAAQPESKKAPA